MAGGSLQVTGGSLHRTGESLHKAEESLHTGDSLHRTEEGLHGTGASRQEARHIIRQSGIPLEDLSGGEMGVTSSEKTPLLPELDDKSD